MKFSTKSEYGLRALVNLAKQKGYYSLAQIAKDEKISLAYLERLFAKLKKSGLVISQKGVNGGYKIAKPLTKITIRDIFVSLEGDLSPYNCNCLDLQSVCDTVKCSCKIKSVWQKLELEVNKTLDSIKLSELVSDK